jgi:hypothetical protein
MTMWLAVRHGMGKAVARQSVLQEVSDRTWSETSIIVVWTQVPGMPGSAVTATEFRGAGTLLARNGFARLPPGSADLRARPALTCTDDIG